MPRPPREQYAGALYHIATRSSAQRPIFTEDAAFTEFLRLLRVTCGRYLWSCHAYTILTTHYHLLVTTRESNLARGMQLLNGLFGRWFNDEYETHGHVFGARYSSVIVESDAHLLHLQAYLAWNAPKAGLCRRPEEWTWSSYRALLGLEPPGFLALKELLRRFAFDPDEARRRIEDYVALHPV